MIDTFAIRCNILKLAFSGQLSQHEIEDGTIDDLLKKVDPNRKIKQAEAVPYEIPEHWAWVKLEDLYNINPRVDAGDDADAAFIPMERISAGFSDSFTYEVQKWSAASKNHTRFADGDVAFAKISPCFENRKSFIATGLPNGIGGGTTELIILRQKEMLPRFTYYVTLDQRFIHDGVASYKGTVGQQRVKSDVIKNFMVAVPPKEEQRRIVERIENIFSVLDTIDALQSKYQDNLATLKSKIIDAGIQGKLTEQLPEDGTAEELYQQIQQEKLALEKAGKIKKSKSLPPISDEEKPFDIPENWKWVRIGEVGITITGGTPAKDHTEYYGGTFPFFKPSDLDAGRHISIASEYLTELGKKESRQLSKGSILVCCIGSIGKSAIMDIDGTANQQINALTPVLCDSNYLQFAIDNSAFQQQLNQGSRATTVSIINKSKFDNCIVPLPPLAEQKRIVAKLEELLPLCEA